MILGNKRGHSHSKGLLGLLFHTHDHHSHEHDAHAPASEATALGIGAVKRSLLVLLATSVLQLVVAVASGSVALLADTVHNLADALTALPLWLAFWVGKRSANRRYTFGYGKAEDVAGIFIVLVIAASAAVTGWESVNRFFNPRPIGHLGWVGAAAILGFAGNALAAVYRTRAGRKIGSAALVADGLHARADAISSIGVLLAVLGAAFGFEQADPVIGLFITIGIISVLVSATRRVYMRLMDAVPAGLADKAEATLARTPGVEGVSGVRIRWVGHNLRAEARVTVDCERSFVEAHRITEEAHHALLHELPALAEAIIHADPCNHDGKDRHDLIAHHF